jgi:hypothetical protein
MRYDNYADKLFYLEDDNMQHIDFEYNKKLTEKQAAIVTSEIYPKYLRAGAGTGKTEVLVQKIGNILDSDIDCALSNFAIWVSC